MYGHRGQHLEKLLAPTPKLAELHGNGITREMTLTVWKSTRSSGWKVVPLPRRVVGTSFSGLSCPAPYEE